VWYLCVCVCVCGWLSRELPETLESETWWTTDYIRCLLPKRREGCGLFVCLSRKRRVSELNFRCPVFSLKINHWHLSPHNKFLSGQWMSIRRKK
jgi:hypothetical protein